MNNYENGKVYKIWSLSGNKIYIGSTTKNYLCERMSAHRRRYRCWVKDKQHYMSSFDLFEEYGLENCKIELLEAKVCTTRDELHRLEGKYIRELSCVNKIIAGRTQQEHDKHRNTLKFVCCCGETYTGSHKNRHEKSKKHLKYTSSTTQ
jgi:GIY-YIG catalytic domain